MSRTYSPHPPEAYSTYGHGPGIALLSEATERDPQGRLDLWNLFYLTYPKVDEYLQGPTLHQAYGEHVSEVCEILDDPALGFLVEALRSGNLPAAARRLINHPRFTHLQLTEAAGDEWVDIMLLRAGQPKAERAEGNVVHLNFRR